MTRECDQILELLGVLEEASGFLTGLMERTERKSLADWARESIRIQRDVLNQAIDAREDHICQVAVGYRELYDAARKEPMTERHNMTLALATALSKATDILFDA